MAALESYEIVSKRVAPFSVIGSYSGFSISNRYFLSLIYCPDKHQRSEDQL